MHTEGATGIMAVAGITVTAGMGMAGDVAGTPTRGGAPGGGLTITGAPGATRITGVILIIMGTILTHPIITTVTVPTITTD